MAHPLPRFAADITSDTYKPNYIITTKANRKDMCWLLTQHYDTSDTSVPSWTGFNQLTIKGKEEVTSVGYLPIIHAPAHENDTLWTVILRCMQISQQLNPEQSTVVTLDEQLYSKVKELQWQNPVICSKIFLRLGSFHIAKKCMRAIGQHYADSGLEEL